MKPVMIKRLLLALALAVFMGALSGCYVAPGYSYVQGGPYGGGAYYGAGPAVVYNGYSSYYGGYYGSYYPYGYGYGGGYYGCCYGGGWYGYGGRYYWRGRGYGGWRGGGWSGGRAASHGSSGGGHYHGH